MDKADRQFSLLERILSIATSVRPGEGKSAAILTLQSFLTLLCYSLIRPAREAIILAEQGAEVRSYATGETEFVFCCESIVIFSCTQFWYPDWDCILYLDGNF